MGFINIDFDLLIRALLIVELVIERADVALDALVCLRNVRIVLLIVLVLLFIFLRWTVPQGLLPISSNHILVIE